MTNTCRLYSNKEIHEMINNQTLSDEFNEYCNRAPQNVRKTIFKWIGKYYETLPYEIVEEKAIPNFPGLYKKFDFLERRLYKESKLLVLFSNSHAFVIDLFNNFKTWVFKKEIFKEYIEKFIMTDHSTSIQGLNANTSYTETIIYEISKDMEAENRQTILDRGYAVAKQKKNAQSKEKKG